MSVNLSPLRAIDLASVSHYNASVDGVRNPAQSPALAAAPDGAMKVARILNRYIGTNFFVAFALSLLLMTFVASLGFVFRLTDLIARGVQWKPIARIFLYSLPVSLLNAGPLAALVACLLVYGRMSRDGEIQAMRSSGLSVAQIVRSTILLTVCLVLAGLWIAFEVEPRAHWVRQTLYAEVRQFSSADLITEGCFQTIEPGLNVYLGRKKDGVLHDVRIYDRREPGLVREIHANSGHIRAAADGAEAGFELFDVRINPFSAEVRKPVHVDQLSLPLPSARVSGRYLHDRKDMGLGELVYSMRHVREAFIYLSDDDMTAQRLVFAYEFSRRVAMAFSPIALVLIGIPFGIREHRKSSGAGIAMSLVIYFAFYGSTMLAESLVNLPEFRPDLMIWVPPALFSGVGVILLWRSR